MDLKTKSGPHFQGGKAIGIRWPVTAVSVDLPFFYYLHFLFVSEWLNYVESGGLKLDLKIVNFPCLYVWYLKMF